MLAGCAHRWRVKARLRRAHAASQSAALKPQFITAGSAPTVRLPASKASEPGYRGTAPPNPSLESGPSEAGRLAREPGCRYSPSPGQGALPLRAAQLKR
jgi:hypothetical protein